MNNPIFFPDAGRNVIKQFRLFQRIPELGPKDRRQRLNRNEEFLFGRKPLAAVGRQSTTGYDIVDMGVVAHIARPGVQSTHHTDVTADEPGVLGQFLQCRRRGLKQFAVNHLLVGSGNRPQFGRQRKGHQKIVGRQQSILLCFNPPLGFILATFGTASVPA